MSNIELLAPAGNYETLVGAINAGADAVYFGFTKYNARGYADNFSLEDLVNGIKFCHLRFKKAFLTINTLVSQNDLPDYLLFLDEMVALGFDAYIVGSVSIIKYLKTTYPDIIIHASTQLNVSTIEEASFLKNLGVSRIILARETPLNDIIKIKTAVDIELEVFVHGALCYSLSGNCLFSGIEYNKSGNRGQCVQPCRESYTMVDEGKTLDNGYLLSMKDLYTIPEIKKVLPYVVSLKIEGRKRKKEYVANVVRNYRGFLDNNIIPDENVLKVSFNRGFTKGYTFNPDKEEKVNKSKPNHQGVVAGKVINVNKYNCSVKLTKDVAIGDGFRIIGLNLEYGNILDYMEVNGVSVKTASIGQTIKIAITKEIENGSFFMITLDKVMENSLNIYFKENHKVVPVIVNIRCLLGLPFKIDIRIAKEVFSIDGPVVVSSLNQPLTKEKIQHSFGTLGQTFFDISEFNVDLSDDAYLPIFDLKELRRTLVDQILVTLEERSKPISLKKVNYRFPTESLSHTGINLYTKVRNQEQYNKLVKLNAFKIYYPFENVVPTRKYDVPYYLTRKKVILPETNHLVANYSLVSNNLANDIDPILNCFNLLDYYFYKEWGAKVIYLSRELSSNEIKSLLDDYKKINGKASDIGLVIYGGIELMVSRSTSITTPKNNIKLINSKNKEYDYLFENGYYLVVSPPKVVTDDLISKVIGKIANFRLDFYLESPTEIETIYNKYQKLLSTRIF